MTYNNNDLDQPLFYNNRELSLISFNERVLREAVEPTNPILEQLKFVAIFSSNTDEFFMVRVAGLLDQIKANFTKRENKAGLTPKEQVARISTEMTRLFRDQYHIYHSLMDRLQDYGWDVLRKPEDLHEFENYFDEFIYPVLTPMVIDAHRPFPMLTNKAIHIGVKLTDHDGDTKTAFLKIPDLLPRLMYSPTQEAFVFIEDIIAHYAHKLFGGFTIDSFTTFRITRNADLTIHEEGARDLLAEIEKELKNREHGAAVRLEIKGSPSSSMLTLLKTELLLEERDIYYQDGPLDLTFLFDFVKERTKANPSLAYPPFEPQQPACLKPKENVFTAARKRDLFFSHPYESFDPIVSFVTDAAEDKNVLAIKQTLYRVSGNSPIIRGLKRAAENGKQVTVLVELKARFDEENNVQWARVLEEAGCHVIYGFPSLKTHSKITLVVRKRGKSIERFVHLGTGNYNDQTAKLYTDMGLITSKSTFGEDATNFFNFVSGATTHPKFHHLSIATEDLQNDLIRLIENEIEIHREHKNGRIIAKMNSLTEKSIIKALYRASREGVQIDLIVRGICCLRPGIPDVSENIRVRSIIGRFLEHSRIYYFHNNGDEKYFLSSADMMTRNMSKRIEIMFPILSSSVQRAVREVLDLQLMDDMKARVQDNEGNYIPLRGRTLNSQLVQLKLAYKRSGKG
ncbi:RNA degradosome polyphosphate kinase [Salimicrobium halophilum]|uniref:Polyphosphate kinase n=1 Tax=Salimicrobium halophilum TaxID=86666 RepID=A0A1G8UBU2_9BACI|nr:RNA degradosome polyphosphate kinase [Salimicrobium halophilum]SDJ50645.1 polyphosphate kinase [Salimicrobium halophilum]